jgi:hypothetical protein
MSSIGASFLSFLSWDVEEVLEDSEQDGCEVLQNQVI